MTMRYPTPRTRRPRIGSEKHRAEFTVLYHRYLRMGFDEREARFKAHEHQTLRL